MGKSKKSKKSNKKYVPKTTNVTTNNNNEPRLLTKQEIKCITDQLPKSKDKLYNMCVRVGLEETLKTLVIPPDTIPYLFAMMMENYKQEVNLDGSLKMNDGLPEEFLQLLNDSVHDDDSE